MDLNLQDINLTDIETLEGSLFSDDENLKDLIALKGIDCYCEFTEVE